MLIVADMDGTLTESRQQAEKGMIDIISKILKKHFFCIISGASYERIRMQILDLISIIPDIKNLYIVAQSGAEIHDWKGTIHKETMSSTAKQLVKLLIHNMILPGTSEMLAKHGIKTGIENPLIVDKGSQITFSITGVNADIRLKKAMDPDVNLRKVIVATLRPFLPPAIEMAIGGTTSIDFTPRGVNKRFGVQYLQKHLGVDIKDIIYIGDKCFEGGNDWIGEEYKYYNVSGPNETLEILKGIRKS